MTTNFPDIVLIGAGNLATQLGIALQKKGFNLIQVYSRTHESASALGHQLNTAYTHMISEIRPDASVYIFAIKDDALPGLLKEMPPLRGLCAHTAGSIPMDVLAGYAPRRGVLYPLQTFSKNKNVDFDHIPIFIEANNEGDENLLYQLAETLSDQVSVLSSEKRKYLHLAAVFACNFSNHMYALASDILKEQQLDWKFLLPLIFETAAKIETMNPDQAQTGPAVRYDQNVIDNHLKLLAGDADKQELYRLISHSIHKKCTFED